jgi:hypothetical protein
MKAVFARLRRLEERAANHEIGAQGPSWVEILWERQRRRAEAEGRPFKEPWVDPKLYKDGKRPTWAEVLQSHQARRAAAKSQQSRESLTI